MSIAITDERRERLAASIRKLRAYHTIQNEMGRVIVAFNFRQPEKILARFALDRPDVSLEYADEGVFIGRHAVETIVREVGGSEPRPGEMTDLHLTTPIIEIADDEQSARAVWWCPGAGAQVSGGDRDPEAIWVWGMIAADLVPDGDTWKLWHFHYFRYIKCSYEKGWVQDTSMINRLNTAMHPLASPTTYHSPYSPFSVRDAIPAAPRPYATYDGTGWMLDRDKSK